MPSFINNGCRDEDMIIFNEETADIVEEKHICYYTLILGKLKNSIGLVKMPLLVYYWRRHRII
jgi:hypothetical protein